MFRFFIKFDWTIFFAALVVLGVGLLALYSLSVGGETDYFFKQLIFSGVSIVAMMFVATLDYRHVARYSTVLYFGTLSVLVLVLIFGRTVNGTAGWLSFGVFQVQPVEIAKLTLILFLASFITKKKSELGEWTRVIASLVLSAGIILLVLKQPDLGSSLVLAAIWIGMILASGLRWKHFLVLFFLGAVLSAGSWLTLEDYQKDRIDTFLHPEHDPKGSGYNVLQAMVAVGSGSLTGKGVGHGSQSQLNFLPEKHTDFIFAVVAEELGLVGAWLVIGAYAVLLYRIKRIGDTASDNFGYLIAVGVFIMMSVQIAINVGMNIGLVPVTGLPAPFLSYGGSSLLSVFLGLGLLLSVYQRKKGTEDMRISLTRSTID
jgi:rod shape determining protein RodA